MVSDTISNRRRTRTVFARIVELIFRENTSRQSDFSPVLRSPFDLFSGRFPSAQNRISSNVRPNVFHIVYIRWPRFRTFSCQTVPTAIVRRSSYFLYVLVNIALPRRIATVYALIPASSFSFLFFKRAFATSFVC